MPVTRNRHEALWLFMLEHRPNSIQDMSNSTVISDSHSHRFDFATPTDLLDPSPTKNQGEVFFVGPGSGMPSHDTLRHRHQLKCTQIRIPHTENPVNNVPGQTLPTIERTGSRKTRNRYHFWIQHPRKRAPPNGRLL